MSEIYLAKSDLTGAIYAVNDKSKTNVTDFVVELIKIETEAQAARIRQLEERLAQAEMVIDRFLQRSNDRGTESFKLATRYRKDFPVEKEQTK